MSIYAKDNPDGVTDLGNAGVLDASDNRINPATEETLKSVAGFNIPEFDEVQVTYPTTSSEVYTFKLSSTTVGVITVTYTNSTKEVLVSAIKS